MDNNSSKDRYSCYVIIILCTTSLVLPTSTLTFLAKSQEKSFWALRPPTPRQHGVLDLANVRPLLFCFPYPVPDVVVETLHTGSGLATILTYPVARTESFGITSERLQLSILQRCVVVYTAAE